MCIDNFVNLHTGYEWEYQFNFSSNIIKTQPLLFKIESNKCIVYKKVGLFQHNLKISYQSVQYIVANGIPRYTVYIPYQISWYTTEIPLISNSYIFSIDKNSV